MIFIRINQGELTSINAINYSRRSFSSHHYCIYIFSQVRKRVIAIIELIPSLRRLHVIDHEFGFITILDNERAWTISDQTVISDVWLSFNFKWLGFDELLFPIFPHFVFHINDVRTLLSMHSLPFRIIQWFYLHPWQLRWLSLGYGMLNLCQRVIANDLSRIS